MSTVPTFLPLPFIKRMARDQNSKMEHPVVYEFDDYKGLTDSLMRDIAVYGKLTMEPTL